MSSAEKKLCLSTLCDIGDFVTLDEESKLNIYREGMLKRKRQLHFIVVTDVSAT